MRLQISGCKWGFSIMKEVQVDSFAMASPDDFSLLENALIRGTIKAPDIRCVVIKTEGNGLANDFTRVLAEQGVSNLLTRFSKPGFSENETPPGIVCSGGTEGVLTPHMMVLSVIENVVPVRTAPRLAFGSALERVIRKPGDTFSYQQQCETVRAAVLRSMREAGINDPEDVHLVLVKAGLPVGLDNAAQQNIKPDLRSSSALGVAMALGEITLTTGWDKLPDPFTNWSSRACVTAASGPETQVFVLGNSLDWGGLLIAGHEILADMLDSPAVARLVGRLGYQARPQLSEQEAGAIKAVFLKGEPPSRTLRGQRHTMWGDSDIHALRHYRAAMGGLLASVLGTTRLYLSAGAEYQGPPGGACLSLIMNAPASQEHVEHGS